MLVRVTSSQREIQDSKIKLQTAKQRAVIRDAENITPAGEKYSVDLHIILTQECPWQPNKAIEIEKTRVNDSDATFDKCHLQSQDLT